MNTRVKRIVLPLGGVAIATGMIAASLATAAGAASSAAPAKDGLATSKAAALKTVKAWTAGNGKRLKAATKLTEDGAVTSKIKLGGGEAEPDGKSGTIPPIGMEKVTPTKVKNVNLPRTIGKVFFRLDGKDYWCSASSVQAKYRNLVATAAHCVYDTDSNRDTLDEWVFIPGYYQAKAPWGIYVGQSAYTSYDFAVYEDFDSDYAFVSVYNGVTADSWNKPVWEDAGRLGDNVGGQGFTWNAPIGRTVYAFGYPAGPHPDGDKPFTGQTPKYCYGKTSAVGPASAFKAEAQIGIKCSMTAGASGGPWITQYSSTKRLGYINGVTSLVGDSNGDSRYDFATSPYFDSETYGIYKKAANLWTGKLAK
ncbi:trypsin-like peptidase domain-containing protein [Sphaerisporangium sp. TRM90804]|uniref:trypsin-like serine peptidase n=1 Tax=Sphaerisporangium sp. TRM90804 TaxID=3031113 RepID=UPI002449B817|nr:trypsin-like peptidase domain-containing protein [Sphaerisporangium sp. TRM90804]MDH2427767.1 trypsin-like peptidase domain-containing protein [Sphaerisporangium sp. TRM90804]